MTVFARMSVLATLFPRKRLAVEPGRRWRKAAAGDSGLAEDVSRMGGILTMQPHRLTDGYAEPAPIDPYALAYDRGRRDLAIQLLALMGLTISEMNRLMEDDDV